MALGDKPLVTLSDGTQRTEAVTGLDINVALLAEETVHWSKENMDIVGNAGKETICYAREYRKPWKLPVYRT